jgi:thiol-disulfide isomerase/thioredoxin
MFKYLANPLISIVTIVIILIVILAIFRAANLTMGFGLQAHLGNLRTSFMIEGFEGEGKKSPALVMYYADWCGHCKRAKPQLEAVKGEYKGKVKIVMLNAEDPENASLLKQEDVQGFPTIRYYKSGMPEAGKKSDYEEYNGDRSKEDFLQFLNRLD